MCLFSKHYFDPKGFIVAVNDDDEMVGFAHAGFGPNDPHNQVETDTGTTYMIMVRDDLWNSNLPDQLLAQSEAYLRGRGAKVLYGGGINPLNGFYLGLYGGSELPGILLSDEPRRRVFSRNQYRERGRVVILQRDLVRFRPMVNREQRRVAREVNFETLYAPITLNWWNTSVYGSLERIRFFLRRRRQDKVLAYVTFWDIEPLASSWGLRAAGMFDLWVDDEYRRHGYGTYLLGESFKELHKRGITTVETQTMLTNAPAIEFYKNLGFAPIDHGLVYRREARNS
ncbi:putative acetyltransferase [Aeoliella mucimassa]|uniref:Putative acetyltransferase n=2 Tax=Aeoliella mucimassa TaxID=2527972 RepID=A0A518ALJ4_9BACT|nr:putative acetyltransferase [Aeoliella mucimassa]